ncbi:TPA: cysteine-rich KTR domain-containing protein [Enterococcus faecium]|uniref:cysteine-rich KTR domain-containing protein n=1 Tax=Enterococcus TaxID=1350 RepID=UPI0009F2599F|nr:MULTISPECIES: cysteine-rich KTR domain-containing protein [Enterococcus]EMF0340871.1 cysteine-rich KTR domain-containing protein [Enterococcus faecium]MDB7281302.1 cysteine-rich KTR domain-containing protein [Enterococcus faecium]MDB7283917.1 cysteine-rich KTR domain-containing protein [Enterococcus faecium]MDB7289024.1 cysteine-rich KTR domain-containing protein [Enterococcus faecium]MDB7294109.1 cysteine-rich KTR domain-containing protein [Enterococcus faecium]
MTESIWILCPICESKTRTKILKKTTLVYFPLYCPKCKQEKIINVDSYKITIINEPDAKTQSR